ncbi:MAG: GNAT family N-acetyltransferase [Magnetococcales bacterium]|nr:GNAT family N-acetyltransferase [Magnetococcales bacterium]
MESNPDFLILPLQPGWQGEAKRLYDAAFARADLPYGRQLPAEFLTRRVFGSLLWSSDCSRVITTPQGEWLGLAVANRRKNPDTPETDRLWLQLFCIAPAWQRQGLGRLLLQHLLSIAAAEAKRGLATSLQWAGMWPGIPVGLEAMLSFCAHTGASLNAGEVYLQKNLQEPWPETDEAVQRAALAREGLRVTPYEPHHRAGLVALLRTHFSVGWQQETLSRIDPTCEPFNGYGLAATLDPTTPGRGIWVLACREEVVGFCLIQQAEGTGSTAFFGPIGLLPTWRGRGLGSHLMREAVRYTQKSGVRTLGLWTSVSIAEGFYIPLGWRRFSATLHAEWLLRPAFP